MCSVTNCFAKASNDGYCSKHLCKYDKCWDSPFETSLYCKHHTCSKAECTKSISKHDDILYDVCVDHYGGGW